MLSLLQLSPDQESLITPCESGKGGCNATQKNWLRFPATRDIRHFQTKLFLTSRRPFLITFTPKSYLRSEIYIAYKFHALYPQKGDFQRGICLCLENVMCVLESVRLELLTAKRHSRYVKESEILERL